ncbi:MAG: hypothetical protein JW726_05090 [Anaerolineales bacterium]|nr:hypothetical protein [Anaerolineales bacterium]
MIADSIQCPSCGAPLHVSNGQTLAVCLYCDSSVRIDQATAQGSATTIHTVQELSKETTEHVKQLVVDGKRQEAIACYQESSGMSKQEAEAAINQISTRLVLKLTHQVPLNMKGILLTAAIIIILMAGLVVSIIQLTKGTNWFFLLAGFFGVMLYERVKWLLPKFKSTLVANWGPEGRAKILKTAVIRTEIGKEVVFVLLLMDVQPASGSLPAFRDEEPILLREKSLHKVQPGNVIRVRYDNQRGDRVFPFSPIEVLEWGAEQPAVAAPAADEQVEAN